jgi:hypothetical protein
MRADIDFGVQKQTVTVQRDGDKLGFVIAHKAEEAVAETSAN